MINKIIIYAMAAVILALGAYSTVQHFKNYRLTNENDDLNKAVIHYEEMIKVIPYNTLAKERKDNANSEINSTLSSDDVISDGTYRL